LNYIQLGGHDDRVWSVTWSPDGKELASSSSDKKIIIWSFNQEGLLVVKVEYKYLQIIIASVE